MTRLILISLSLGAIASLSPSGAQADALDHVNEGASLYGEVRPVALAGVLKRLGVDELPALKRIKDNLGGIDILNPAILAPSGIDVASPIAVEIDFSPAASVSHARAAATLRDASTFRTFVGIIAAGGQVPLKVVAPDSPEGKLGVLFTASSSEDVIAIARIDGETLFVDAVNTWGGKALPAAEVARRYPTDVKSPFVAGRGARRLFASDTAIALYTDGRRFGELLEAVYRQDLEDDLKKAPKPSRAALKQKRLLKMKKCLADWKLAPSTFDDFGLELAADSREVRFTLGWGTLGETPLGGLRFNPVDDHGVDYEMLARQAPVAGALYAASASPFVGLKHTGIYSTVTTVGDYGKRCGDEVNIGIAVRGWPLVAAAGLADLNKSATKQATPGGGFDASTLMSAFGQLRNLIVMVRDFSNSSAQFSVSATFDPSAKPLLELVLAAFGGQGAPKSLAPNRTPTVYSIANPAVGSFVGAMETLANGHVMFTLADSDESLQMAYRKPTAMPGAAVSTSRATTPILAVHLDGGVVARLATNAGAGDSAKPAIDLLSHLKRVDADLAADGDLFRFTVRAPTK